MFLFIARFLRGLILGWVMTLIFYLIKRIVARTFGDIAAPQSHPYSPQQNTQTQDNHNVVETIWVGMPVERLRQSFGAPHKKENHPNAEIWTYSNLNGQGTETRITIENNTVSGWQDTKIKGD